MRLKLGKLGVAASFTYSTLKLSSIPLPITSRFHVLSIVAPVPIFIDG
jgi:hypothetical protein